MHFSRVRAARIRFGAAYNVLLTRRGFHSQHRTPILPQLHVEDVATTSRVHVGYVLQRSQIVRHTAHPLEIEASYLLEREHQRYSRHEANESASDFMSSRGQCIDVQNRTDAAQIKSNFYALDSYQDTMRVMMQRYNPAKRVTDNDFSDYITWVAEQPPQRHTLFRKLDDYLYLIVRDAESGRWTIPSASRQTNETLRMTAERAIATHHAHALECYMWSNAPQATVVLPDANIHLFMYVGVYLSGRPHFGGITPPVSDHAWVTRHEMRQYAADFQSTSLLDALQDICADSTFES